jgi:hypothetical protein
MTMILIGCFLAIAGIGGLLYSQAVLHTYFCNVSCILPFGARSIGDFVLMSYAGIVLIALGAGLFTVFTTVFLVQRRTTN